MSPGFPTDIPSMKYFVDAGLLWRMECLFQGFGTGNPV